MLFRDELSVRSRAQAAGRCILRSRTWGWALEAKPMKTTADLLTRAIDDIERAIAMRQQAAEMRLQLWLERLASHGMLNGRDALLEQALDAALSVTLADCANIQLLPPSGRGLELKAQRRFQRSFLDFFAFVDDGDTACARAWSERRPVVVEDITSSPIFFQSRALEVLLEAGVRAVK